MNSIIKKLVVFVGLSGLFAGNSFAMSPQKVREAIEECKQSYIMLRIAQGPRQPTTQSNFNYAEYQKLFDEAFNVGLVAKYRKMLEKVNQLGIEPYEHALFQNFISPVNLQWTAYFQNEYSINDNAFSLNTSKVGKTAQDNPLLGYYTFQGKKPSPITCYGVLQGLFDATKEMTDQQLIASGNAFLMQLRVNLKQAIENAKQGK